MEKKNNGLWMVLISGFIFGIMPLAVTLCYRLGAVKQTMLLARYFVLAVILLPVVLRQKDTFRLYKDNFPKLLLLSAAGASTPLFLYSAYECQSTGLTTTLHFLYPSAVVLLDRIFYRKKITGKKAISLLLCLAGVVLLLDLRESGSLKGLLFTFASVVTWSLYIVLMDHLRPEGVSSFQMMFYVSVNGLALLSVYVLASGVDPFALTGAGWLAVTGACLVIALFGTLFFALGIRKTDAQTAAIASTLEPITSLAAGAIFLRESLRVQSVIGSVLILAAVVLVAISEKKKSA